MAKKKGSVMNIPGQLMYIGKEVAKDYFSEYTYSLSSLVDDSKEILDLADKILKLPFRVACNLYQYYMVEAFLKNNIHLSSVIYRSFAELESAPPKADFYISGSDQRKFLMIFPPLEFF